MDQGIRVREKKGKGKSGKVLRAWTAQDSCIVLLPCELPGTWLVFNFCGFRTEALPDNGDALDLQGPLPVPCWTQKPWRSWGL